MRQNNKHLFETQSSSRGGYTILEVMIFLAVSVALAVSALSLVGGQQAKTEFAQSVRDLDSRIQDIINDVSTGYYVNNNNFTCKADPSGPIITEVANSNSQGQNSGCIILGEVIDFGINNNQEFRLFPVVGLRQSGAPPKDVAKLEDAKPTAIAKTSAGDTTPDGTQTGSLQYGLRIKSINYDSGFGLQPIGAIGFMTGLDNTSAGGLQSGSRTADLYYVVGSSLTPADSFDTASKIKGLTKDMKNPSGGIVICMESTARANQIATITIGSNGRQLSTSLEIIDGVSCP